MKIGEKIDFLMKVTDTSNSALGKAVCFDASYISRIRGGKRNLPKDQPFLEPAAIYFSKNLKNCCQRKILSEIMTDGREWPADEKAAEKIIFNWLSGEDKEESKFDSGFFCGEDGRKKAITVFFSRLLKTENIPRLYIYSDEERIFTKESIDFSKKCFDILLSFLLKGGKITFVCSDKNVDSAVRKIIKALPENLSENIEVFNSSEISEKIFCKTVMIASGYAAFVYSSVLNDRKNSVSCLICDKAVVKALENEYGSFMYLCKCSGRKIS